MEHFLAQLVKEKYDYEKELLEDKTPPKIRETNFHKKLNYEKIDTIYDIVCSSGTLFKEEKLYGWRKLDENQQRKNYVWESYGDVSLKVTNFSSALQHLVEDLNKEETGKTIETNDCKLNGNVGDCSKMNGNKVTIDENGKKNDEKTENQKTENQKEENQKNEGAFENGGKVEENGEKSDEIIENGEKMEEKVENVQKKEKIEENGEKSDEIIENGEKTEEKVENAEKIEENGEKRKELTVNGEKTEEKVENIQKKEENAENGQKIDENGEKGKESTENGHKTDEKVENIQKKEETVKNSQKIDEKTKPEEKIDYYNDKFENVGIYAVNRPEWMISSLGTQSICMKSVALYDTLGKDAVKFILNNADIRIVVCSFDKVRKLLELKRDQNIGIKVIIQMDFNPKFNNIRDKICDEDKILADSLNVKLIGFSEFIKTGERKMESFNPIRPRKENLATIMYTSGTSGRPKGVMITHRNLVSMVKFIPKRIEMQSRMLYLSYLPLAHIFEMIVQMVFLFSGNSVGFYSGHPQMIAEDIKELRPHFLAGVPRVFDKIYGKIISKITNSGAITRFLFKKAYLNGLKASRMPDKIGKPYFLDFLLWAKIRKKMGLDRCTYVLTGGAPCPLHIIEFLRILLVCPVIQGYGLTETCAVVAITNPDDIHLGHTGHPTTVELRLDAIPGSMYDPNGEQKRGELCVRGESIFVGYHKNKELTEEVLSEDGWFRTGDVARLNPNGSVSIVDRHKALFKLSQGEYISPEKVEAAYGECSAVNQIFVYGDSLRNFAVAIVVPSIGWIIEFMSSDKNISNEDKKLLDMSINDEKSVVAAIGRLGKDLQENAQKELLERQMKDYEKKLERFEMVKKVFVEFNVDETFSGFSVENDLLTPSFKMRRPNLVQRYKSVIDGLYVEETK